jgi:hypothetical protein
MRRAGIFCSTLTLAAGLIVGSGCAAADDPFTSGPAHASVSGLVTDPRGGAIPATSVRIACADGGSPLLLTTDSSGDYLANLQTGADPFPGSYGRLRCQFAEPGTGTPRVQLDTTLGFVRGPVLVALQLIDLHEP